MLAPPPPKKKFVLTPSIEVYHTINVRRNFDKFLYYVTPSPSPPSPIVKGGGAEIMYTIKLLSYLVKNNMEPYYPCT